MVSRSTRQPQSYEDVLARIEARIPDIPTAPDVDTKLYAMRFRRETDDNGGESSSSARSPFELGVAAGKAAAAQAAASVVLEDEQKAIAERDALISESNFTNVTLMLPVLGMAAATIVALSDKVSVSLVATMAVSAVLAGANAVRGWKGLLPESDGRVRKIIAIAFFLVNTLALAGMLSGLTALAT